MTEDPQPLTEVETPGAVTIELMVEQMGLPAEATMKCILFDVEGGRSRCSSRATAR